VRCAWSTKLPLARSALGRDRARCLTVRFHHPPRLEPCMQLSPHTAQHLLDASSPVTVPRHPTGIPRGSHSGTWVTGRANRLWAFPLYVAFPRAEYYAHTATPSGLGVSPSVSTQLRSARLLIPLGASHVHGSGLLRRPVGSGFRPSLPLSAAPQHDTGYTGSPASAFSPLLELRRYGSCFAYWLQNVLAVLLGKVGQGTTYP